MRKLTASQIDDYRRATLAYLRAKYPQGDLTWHPLFTAVRELFIQQEQERWLQERW